MHISLFRCVLLSATAPAALAAIAISSPALADPTAPCNASAGSDGSVGTSDDGLECGSNSSASTDSTAVGNNATAIAGKAVAVGDTALIESTGTGGVALGASSYVSELAGVAVGSSARSTGPSAIAVGQNSRSTGIASIAIGSDSGDFGPEGATASGTYSIAIGMDANATSVSHFGNCYHITVD